MTNGFSVSVNDRAVLVKLDRLPDDVRARLVDKMRGSIVPRLQAGVKASEPVRTGKLRGETTGFVNESPTKVQGRVVVVAKGSEAGKAAALEYGAHGNAAVREYSRSSAAVVDAYSRSVNIVAQHFLRGTLAAEKEGIMDELQEALGEAAA
jgi:hypothetical protein